MAGCRENYLIVAAIDFGTAYSGYAYSVRDTFKKDPTKAATFTWASGTGKLLSEKTTTCALFDPKKKFHSFGFEAEDKYSNLALDGEHHDWYFFKHFKMDLYEKEGLNRDLQIEDTLGRTLPAMQIFSNSIAYLKNHLLKECKDRIAGSVEEDIRWVLTVPTIWDDAAKQFMREAAVNAGIANDRLLIALEPEAASLFCKYLPIEKFSVTGQGLTPFQTGSKYMVIDAGGGTIDITVHEVKQDGSLSEVFKASGGNWGGTFVDKAFEQFLADIIGNDVMETFIKDQMIDYIELFRNFEVKKRSFQGQVTEKVMFKVPVSMNETFKNEHKRNIKDILSSTHNADKVSWDGDKLRISPDTVNEFFDVSFREIVAHLKKIFLSPNCNDVRFILMVGGFSESKMMQDRIKESFPDKTVVFPHEPGLAVLKGAVIFGHDQSLLSQRKTKYTFGISTSRPFIHGRDPELKKFYNDDNISFCDDIFDVHIPIDSTVKTGEKCAKVYEVVNKSQSAMKIDVYTSKERNPTYVTDEGCVFKGILILKVPGFGLGRKALVQMMFGETELQVTVSAHNIQVEGNVSAEFDFLSGDGPSDSRQDKEFTVTDQNIDSAASVRCDGQPDSGVDEDLEFSETCCCCRPIYVWPGRMSANRCRCPSSGVCICDCLSGLVRPSVRQFFSNMFEN